MRGLVSKHPIRITRISLGMTENSNGRQMGGYFWSVG
jgi:hypothetical protein